MKQTNLPPRDPFRLWLWLIDALVVDPFESLFRPRPKALQTRHPTQKRRCCRKRRPRR